MMRKRSRFLLSRKVQAEVFYCDSNCEDQGRVRSDNTRLKYTTASDTLSLGTIMVQTAAKLLTAASTEILFCYYNIIMLYCLIQRQSNNVSETTSCHQVCTSKPGCSQMELAACPSHQSSSISLQQPSSD